jgi:hypothetical protein
MGPLYRSQSLPHARELASQTFELFEMQSRQSLKSLCAGRGEAQPDHPVILLVPGPAYQAIRISTVDETHRAVVAQQQVVGHLANGWALGIAVPSDGKQQLVLSGRQAGGARLLFAPPLKVPKPGSQGEEPAIDVVRQTQSCHDIIVTRCNGPILALLAL